MNSLRIDLQKSNHPARLAILNETHFAPTAKKRQPLLIIIRISPGESSAVAPFVCLCPPAPPRSTALLCPFFAALLRPFRVVLAHRVARQQRLRLRPLPRRLPPNRPASSRIAPSVPFLLPHLLYLWLFWPLIHLINLRYFTFLTYLRYLKKQPQNHRLNEKNAPFWGVVFQINSCPPAPKPGNVPPNRLIIQKNGMHLLFTPLFPPPSPTFRIDPRCYVKPPARTP